MTVETMTITEALQEVKTKQKRIDKKQEFITGVIWRQANMRDPHEKAGGSATLIASERQSIDDLQDDIIEIRRRIAAANDATAITICGISKTISEWLVWRREIAVGRKRFLEKLYSGIQHIREQARQKGVAVAESESRAGEIDVIVNLDEKALADEIEQMEEILSSLDGQLSLKNATVTI